MNTLRALLAIVWHYMKLPFKAKPAEPVVEDPMVHASVPLLFRIPGIPAKRKRIFAEVGQKTIHLHRDAVGGLERQLKGLHIANKSRDWSTADVRSKKEAQASAEKKLFSFAKLREAIGPARPA